MNGAGRPGAPAPHVRPLTGTARDFDPLITQIGGARFVLIGEASHGTHEFYKIRGEITKRLIVEQGFSAVAVEADWPDAYRVNRFVRGIGDDTGAVDALGDFERFPQWMWRNADVLDFIGWLRAHNDSLPRGTQRAGFYGLDLYSLHSSIDAVLRYLDSVDPPAARRARDRYACFDHFGGDPQNYASAVSAGWAPSCEPEVIAQLVELRRSAAAYAKRDAGSDPDAAFQAEQNARVVVNAEEYYRAMFGSRVSSWNLRDHHMAETLGALDVHLSRQRPAKIVVWAHNSHLGDARATEMSRSGELNLGQLVRERHDGAAFLIGFSTFGGTVTAASDWGAPAERKVVRPGLRGSYESLFHEMGGPNFMLDLRSAADDALRHPKLQRAIGVIYRPETERQSHYFHASLASQFDALLHYDVTRAVEPLERTASWSRGETPETFPTAL